MPVEVVGSIVVAAQDVEGVAVDLDISANSHVSRGDPGTILVDVLVLMAVKEFAFDNSRVLLGWLVN